MIVMRREGPDMAMRIAGLNAGISGTVLREDGGNVKKEDDCGVNKRDVGFVELNVTVMSTGMTGIEGIKPSCCYVLCPDA